MKPNIHRQGTGIRAGYDYCVSIPNFKLTYTSPSYTYPTMPNPLSLQTPLQKAASRRMVGMEAVTSSSIVVVSSQVMGSSVKPTSKK
jgi:hypothetical protein